MPDGVDALDVDGRTRTYVWHSPASLTRPAPLVLVLHGPQADDIAVRGMI